MKKLVFSAALASALMLGACSEEEKDQETTAAVVENTKEETQITEPVTVDEDEVIANAGNMTGGTFLKGVTVVDNIAVIEFYESYDAYKTDNPQSGVTEDQYKEYFETGEAIEKILVIENVRLMRKTPALVGVKATLPFDGKTYSIDLERVALTDYLGFDVGELVENKDWSEKFMKPIGDDKTKRNELFLKFGTIK